ncbi:unnamed protein product [Discula destructiva]
MGRPPGSKNRVGRPRGGGRPRGSGRPPGRPPGRPRRYSNSTVASVDLECAKYLEETSVLKPQESLDSDGWPVFVLLDAVIYRRTKHGQLEIANACNVDLDGPFIIRGKLDVDLKDPAEATSLRNYAQKSAYIEISSSKMYSVGWKNEAEEAVVWSAGKSGWFEICPAAEYRGMHETVCEGITLYYLLQEIYEDARDRAGKGKRSKALMMPVEQLLKQYALRLGDGVTLSEAKERCQKHAPFLLAHFNRDMSLNWKATSLQKWMTDTNPKLCQRLKEAEDKQRSLRDLRDPVPLAQPASQEPHASTWPKANPEDEAKLLSRRTTPALSDRERRTRATRATRARGIRLSQESDIDMTDAPAAQAPTRVETRILPPSIPMRAAQAPASLPAPATPSGQKAHEPTDPLVYPVQSFLELLEEIMEETETLPKVTAGRVHSRMYLKCSTVYNAPVVVSHFYAKQLAASLPSKWYQTPYFKWLLEERNKPWEPGPLTRDTVALQLKRRRKMPHLAKPKLREPEGTSTPHIGKRLPMTPRTGALTLKRPRPTYIGDGYMDDDQSSKHARTSANSDADNSEDEQVNDSSDAAPARTYRYSTTPIPVPRIPRETVPIVVRAEKIPTVSPAGPNGTWRCDEDGCGYIVRSAEEPEGKLLIDKHFQDHAKRVEKVNIALAEGTRGNLPINHLLEKIRSMGEAIRKEQGADGAFPDPVKRRLIL